MILTSNSSIAAIILAAGKGTRFKATKARNKVAYNLREKPMVAHTVTHLKTAGINQIVVVVGFAAPSVKTALGTQVNYAYQTKRLGTGHAVKVGLSFLPSPVKTVITMYGDDSAFYPASLFTGLLKSHRDSQSSLSLVTITVVNPNGLGRIIRGEDGHVKAIVEEKVATGAEKQIKEINTGLFCFQKEFILEALKHLAKNPVSHEYYLTDVVAYAVAKKLTINAVKWPDNSIWHGANTRAELAKLQGYSSLLGSSVA